MTNKIIIDPFEGEKDKVVVDLGPIIKPIPMPRPIPIPVPGPIGLVVY